MLHDEKTLSEDVDAGHAVFLGILVKLKMPFSQFHCGSLNLPLLSFANIPQSIITGHPSPSLSPPTSTNTMLNNALSTRGVFRLNMADVLRSHKLQSSYVLFGIKCVVSRMAKFKIENSQGDEQGRRS